ncbi:cryptochrome/photolyase family protein [Thiobacter aerophilum]|uniref:Deoxyribodipyrimidine photo-lyase n=1 Tax=Thiobacter aerophilum TaxID=3121275 RepID=A0ABV0EF07_9BURK
MTLRYDRVLVWFRRDLRDHDHAALSRALHEARAVYCAFVFDTDILDALPDRSDRRVEFIWHSVRELDAALAALGGGLRVEVGRARAVIPRLARELGCDAVYANRDYEPEAVARDECVAHRLREASIAFHLFTDQLIFAPEEVVSAAGQPYRVFTPYKNAWLKGLDEARLAPHPVAERTHRLAPPGKRTLPTLEALGFSSTDLLQRGVAPGMGGAKRTWAAFQERLSDYHLLRDRPDLDATSHLSVHLRHGTISVRALVRHAYHTQGDGARIWLGELIWREFFQMILHFHPRVVDHAFRPEFDDLRWPGGDDVFAAWCVGRTGYPIVDAGMRQLTATGFMHNRVRMIVASFLTKDLLVDWRRGERHFARWLLDYELASNNGNWQWAASTGCDAQPYFRIFNPVAQSEKYDPDGSYIRRWVPELARVPDAAIHAPWQMRPIEQEACGFRIGRDYPAPIVDHAAARARALAWFSSARVQ